MGSKYQHLPASHSNAGMWRTQTVIRNLGSAHPLRLKREVVEWATYTTHSHQLVQPKRGPAKYQMVALDGAELLDFNGVKLLRRQCHEVGLDLDSNPAVTSPEGARLLIELIKAKVFRYGPDTIELTPELVSYIDEGWSFHERYADEKWRHAVCGYSQAWQRFAESQPAVLDHHKKIGDFQ